MWECSLHPVIRLSAIGWSTYCAAERSSEARLPEQGIPGTAYTSSQTPEGSGNCTADCEPGLQPHTTDAAVGSGTDHITTADALAAWTSQLPSNPEKVAVAQLPWLPAHKIKLTMECIASTSFAQVMKVTLCSIALLCSSVLHMQGFIHEAHIWTSYIDLKVPCNGLNFMEQFVAGISRQGGVGCESLP